MICMRAGVWGAERWTMVNFWLLTDKYFVGMSVDRVHLYREDCRCQRFGYPMWWSWTYLCWRNSCNYCCRHQRGAATFEMLAAYSSPWVTLGIPFFLLVRFCVQWNRQNTSNKTLMEYKMEKSREKNETRWLQLGAVVVLSFLHFKHTKTYILLRFSRFQVTYQKCDFFSRHSYFFVGKREKWFLCVCV